MNRRILIHYPQRLVVLTLAVFMSTIAVLYADKDEEDEAKTIREEVYQYITKNEEGRALVLFIREKLPPYAHETIKWTLREEPWEAQDIIEYMREIQEEYLDLQQRDEGVASSFLAMVGHEIIAESLSNKLREADEEDSEVDEIHKLKTQLRKELEMAFEKKLEIQKYEIQVLEQEVNELKGFLQKRISSKPQIIERRFKELIGEYDHLDW